MKKTYIFITLTIFASTVYAQDIKNTLGTNGNFEVITSSNTETLTVTDDSQVIISDIDNPTPQATVILDLNSTKSTLQLPRINPSIWIGSDVHGPGRIFWNTGDAGGLAVFTGTGILDFTSILDTRSPMNSLSNVQGNGINNNSYYIGADAGLTADPNDNNNVAFGVNALKNLNSAFSASTESEENVAIGFEAGLYIITGMGNTAIGAQAGVPQFGGGSSLNYTTAIGYNATPDADNQIRLGRDVDHVVIPGVLKVQDVLNLKPRATAPLNPEIGDMYYNSGTKRLMIFGGGTTAVWKTIQWL
ncbi:hypothetical protein [Lacinutrix jangbogonensis]|uniref:hypothetical protein n=1 Tax=Lacinutrix jangbogonensis TaxID=1469557 RepID=UPI00053E65C4|nr:hypothetical protein [Lacinutrix jangbogonensis]